MAKILPVLTEPNQILRKKSKNLNLKLINSPQVQELYLNMAATMKQQDGAGLAASQIGKNLRIAVINTKNRVVCLINPRLTKKSWAKEWGEEGCLSVPGVFGQVKRHKKISCRFYDNKGHRLNLTAQGLLARVIQHELDHLDGILIIDKARNLHKPANITHNL